MVSQEAGVEYSTIYEYAQFDACDTPFRIDGISKGFDQLQRIQRDKSKDLSGVLGCGTPKLRLVSNAVNYQNSAEALKQMATMPDLFSTVVMSGNNELKSKENEKVNGMINVTEFVDDDLKAEVNVLAPSGAWLVYADSYTPGWHASIDGIETSVYQAYAAFKAVWVGAGQHQVHFFYRNTVVLWSSYIIAFVGLIAGCVLIFLVMRQIIL